MLGNNVFERIVRLRGLLEADWPEAVLRPVSLALADHVTKRSTGIGEAFTQSRAQAALELRQWIEAGAKGPRVIALALAIEERGSVKFPIRVALETASTLERYLAGEDPPPFTAPLHPAQERIAAERRYSDMVASLHAAGMSESDSRAEARRSTGFEDGRQEIPRRGPPRRPEPPKAA